MFVDRRIVPGLPAEGSVLDLYPQFRMPGRYQDHALRFLQALADSSDYDWTVAVAPRTSPVNDPSTVAAFDTVEHEFNVVPRSVVWGLTSVSDQASGFRFELWDQGRAVPFAIAKAQNGALSGDIGNSTFGAPAPFVFDRPYTIIGTGLVSVRITNLAAAANALQLCIFIAQPKIPVDVRCRN